MKIIVISFIIVNIGIQSIIATEINWGCQTPLFSNIAAIGDSRALQLARTFYPNEPINAIQAAKLNDKGILLPNQVVIQDLSQFGSQTDDWIDKIHKCQDWNGIGYFNVPEFTIWSGGGNDALDYIKNKIKNKQVSASEAIQNFKKNYFGNIRMKGQALIRNVRSTTLKGFLRSPLKTLANFGHALINFITSPILNITQNPFAKYPEYQSQWEWQDHTATDTIATNVKTILPHLLDQPNDLKYLNHKVMLNTVAPASTKSFMFVAGFNTDTTVDPLPFPITPGYAVLDGIKDFNTYYTNVIKVFNMLHSKYRKDVFKPLHERYGDRIVLVDSYYGFLNNILKGHETFYWDGIHFTHGRDKIDDSGNSVHIEGGMEYWGKLMAVSMVQNKWANCALTPCTPQTTLYTDPELAYSAGAINDFAQRGGIDKDLAEQTALDTFTLGAGKFFYRDEIEINYKAYTIYINDDINFVYRNGDQSVRGVRGDIFWTYSGSGGPDGALGFPLAEEIVGSFGSIRTQQFECGVISRNYLDILHPYASISMNESTPECVAKKARDAN